jgi:hypothetical protein
MASLPAILPTPQEPLDRRLSMDQISARRSAIRELMKKAMRAEIDYGTIPGTPKPTLYKSGAEKLCALFQLAPRVQVQDLSTPDAIRYQVKVELYSATGIFCGEGVGTASSAETKYQWRAAVCREEFEATPEDQRRVLYKKTREGGFFTVIQVRTVPEDADNTILKMAKKRALIDAVLTVTAASDIFTQDLEDFDLPAEPVDTNSDAAPQPSRPQPAAKPAARPAPQAASAPTISEPQQRRFFAIASGAGKSQNEIKQYLFQTFGIEHSRDLKRADYETACAWAARQHEEDLEPREEEPF